MKILNLQEGQRMRYLRNLESDFLSRNGAHTEDNLDFALTGISRSPNRSAQNIKKAQQHLQTQTKEKKTKELVDDSYADFIQGAHGETI
jgi:hypothetical protein